MKKAIILFNLGGPDNLDNVRPFLFNLFNDPAILDLPNWLRYPLAKLISNRRTPIAKKIYQEMGGSSPILRLTKLQAESLEKKINENLKKDIYKCFVVMRCWHPRAETAIQNIEEFNPKEIILLPLYPQYSASTSGSSIQEWKNICEKKNIMIPTKIVCCYPTENKFIQAHSDLISKEVKNLKNYKLIFSAHGLPEKNIKKGDPYQWQVEQTVAKIVEKLNIDKLNWVLSYQSRIGPLKWIGPATDSEIIKAAKENKTIVVVPVAFVSEHSETLVELDIEYKKLANKNGCKDYKRIPALGTSDEFINSLCQLVINTSESLNNHKGYFYPENKCPTKFNKCPCSVRV